MLRNLSFIHSSINLFTIVYLQVRSKLTGTDDGDMRQFSVPLSVTNDLKAGGATTTEKLTGDQGDQGLGPNIAPRARSKGRAGC